MSDPMVDESLKREIGATWHLESKADAELDVGGRVTLSVSRGELEFTFPEEGGIAIRITDRGREVCRAHGVTFP